MDSQGCGFVKGPSLKYDLSVVVLCVCVYIDTHTHTSFVVFTGGCVYFDTSTLYEEGKLPCEICTYLECFSDRFVQCLHIHQILYFLSFNQPLGCLGVDLCIVFSLEEELCLRSYVNAFLPPGR